MQELLCKDTKQCWHQSPATKPAANYKSMSHYAAMSAHLAAKGKVPEGPAVISLSSLPWREGDSAEVPSKGTCASTAAGLTALPAWEAGQLCCSSLSPQALYSHTGQLLLSPLPWRKVLGKGALSYSPHSQELYNPPSKRQCHFGINNCPIHSHS